MNKNWTEKAVREYLTDEFNPWFYRAIFTPYRTKPVKYYYKKYEPPLQPNSPRPMIVFSLTRSQKNEILFPPNWWTWCEDNNSRKSIWFRDVDTDTVRRFTRASFTPVKDSFGILTLHDEHIPAKLPRDHGVAF